RPVLNRRAVLPLASNGLPRPQARAGPWAGEGHGGPGAATKSALRERPSRRLAVMTRKSTLFGWAFGDPGRGDDAPYVEQLKAAALRNAGETAAARGLQIVPDTAVFALVTEADTLIDGGETGHGKLVVRCTVDVTGPGAERVSAEGPMNG
ncbi:hypothetical protein ACFQ36_16355, partial [Arthrobacter sp. GCM10027362]|uniref:hypothetical protein n=1 Tax=Arthrobacter sp. GCM10027362 TaxID=3273379 RepID=UPI0036392349